MGSSAVTEASGERVFVIGDLHGCVKEPEILLRHLESSEGLKESDLVIFLGDYIDRGPDSKGVIDLMLDFRTRFPKTRFLKGNHEDMLLHYLGRRGRHGEVYLENGGSMTLAVDAPSAIAPYVATKGSVAIDGVSLTVNGVSGGRFHVNLIPHTLAVTTLGRLAAGTRVNLEADLIARYVARWDEYRGQSGIRP